MLLKTLVLGLGNPILGDDGVGWRVVEACQKAFSTSASASDADSSSSALIFPDQAVEFDCLGSGGLSLMERLIGYDRAILVDAMQTGSTDPGSVCCCELSDLADPHLGHSASPHDATLKTAIALGRSLGASLPSPIWVVTIEAREVFEFTPELSPLVAQAVKPAVQQVRALLISLYSPTPGR